MAHANDIWAASTLAVTAGRPTGPGDPLNQPPVLASNFLAGGAADYARFGTPSSAAFEAALGALEGGQAVAFSTGMAASAAILEGLPAGATVLTASNIYHGVRTLLADMQSRDRLYDRSVDATDLRAVETALEGAALLWIETPSNPLIQVLDLASLCALAASRNIPVAVDSTFATPVLQRPLEFGATYVLHSATKYIGGHSDLMMGAVVTADESAELTEQIVRRRSLHGAFPGAMECFLALRGIRTMALRVQQSEASAQVLAERLVDHPAVTRVFYPGLAADPGHELARAQMSGFGGMLSFCVESEDVADAVLARTKLIVMATSLGGVESTAERRNRWNEGAPTGLIRFSVGIEDVEDIWADLDAALQ
ncbi:MAG: PLP-dependent aspartate aminotransferase family protein [Antricoccus sp.]